MTERFETAGTAIYQGNVKIAQCLDKDAGELFGDNILPRQEWRDLLPAYEWAAANADLLVYRANEYHTLRAQRDSLAAALEGIFAQTAKHSRQWGQAAGAHAFASDPATAAAFAKARAALAAVKGAE